MERSDQLRAALFALGEHVTSARQYFYSDPDYQAICDAIDALAALRAERDAIRPAVRAFAALMETKLREKDAAGYPAWDTNDVYERLQAIQYEYDETLDALEAALPVGEVIKELADVANCAMIAADRLQPLCAHDGRGRAVEGER